MTTEQWRVEWQKWSDRVETLSHDVVRYEAWLDEPRDTSKGVEYSLDYTLRHTLMNMQTLLRMATERRDAIRKYAPKETP